MEYAVIFLVCTFSGVLTGLLGIGGGLVIVPFFMSVLPLFGMHDFSLHQIVAISATCVFMNSATTVFYRRKQEYLPFGTLYKLAIAIIVGTALGSYLTMFAPAKLILGIYICVGLISVYSINRDIYFDLQGSRFKFVLYIIFGLIGAISSSIGIGGAVLFATSLKCFFDRNTKALLPTITLLVLVHAFFAFGSKLVLGEVVLFMIPIAFVASLVGSRIGVWLSGGMTSSMLNKAMGLVLLFGIVRVAVALVTGG